MSEAGESTAAVTGGAFPAVLRGWRNARGMSQLALSLEAGVSTRHLSYLETGRANPSREMVRRLAAALQVPLRERNAMLESAGFVALYPETPLDAAPMAPVREAIGFMLRSMEPTPSFVVSRRYDILDANRAGEWLLSTFTDDLASFEKPHNFARLLVSGAGMRRHVVNWTTVARKVLRRVQRELEAPRARNADDEALLATVVPALAGLHYPEDMDLPQPVAAPVRLRRDGLALNLFTTIATLGTPLDVTLDEMRIELLFPADEDSRAILSSHQIPEGRAARELQGDESDREGDGARGGAHGESGPLARE